MTVEAILKSKGSKVVTIRPEATIANAVKRLKMENIGAIVVSEDGQEILGILSERDVVHGLSREGAGLLNRPVSQVMMHPVRICRPSDSVKSVMAVMTRYRVRHLPVVDAGVLCGIISIGDVVKRRLDDLEMETMVARDTYFATR